MTISAQALHRVSHFFDSYAQALEHHDIKQIALHYSLPCTMLDDDSSVVFAESGKLEALFVQATGFYRQYGIARARAEVWSKLPLSERTLQVKVTWRYYDIAGILLYTCDYFYLLRLDRNDAWKIQVVVSVNEKERMNAWLDSRG